jgi:dihydrofolate reductase
MTSVLVDLVISLNGMIARPNGDEDWLPEDGWDSFLKQIDGYQNVIIGRETYELVKKKYDHENFDAIKTKLKIIISSKPTYKAPSREYVVAHSPEEALDYVKKAGLKTAYVGGGGKICAAFLNANLVDKVQLTVMPYIIPAGRSFVSDILNKDISLTLISSQRKSQGRLINTYKVNK